ncbi:MAG: lipoate--protein ligase family protein [Leptolyngbyaceae cyanobacterium SM2_3_12]|nr:lipoate--protein ligase family protein [Leptolyngbyaceae cyanobacterium SM2_3_12]
MAIDAWLLEQHQNHQHPPTLRFYTWSPAAISLGVSQRRHCPNHWRQIRWQGRPLDLVQRPTGGRGVLHQGDLTYAIVASHLPGDREQGYRHLCQFLVQGWGQLGVELRFGSPDRRYARSQNCFGLATNADLVDSLGTKRVGSAQLRRGPYILQHGSMPISPDPELVQQVFQGSGLLPPQSQPPIPIPRLIEALTQAAAQCFGDQMIPQPLTPQEWQAIQALAAKTMARWFKPPSHYFGDPIWKAQPLGTRT